MTGEGGHDDRTLRGLEERVAALEAGRGGGLQHLVTVVVGAVGTSVGIIALLTLFGGISEAARARGLHLSGTSTLGVASQQELVAHGADALVSGLLVASIAVALLFVAEHVRTPKSRSSPLISRGWFVAIYASLVAAAAVAIYVVTSADGSRDFKWGLLIVVPVAAVGAVVTWAVAERMAVDDRTTPLSWVSCVVFASVLVYSAVGIYWRNRVHPSARIAAIVRNGGEDLAGIWVGQGNDFMYVALVVPGQPRRIVAVRRESVVAYALGNYRALDGADVRANRLLQDLRADVQR